MNELSLYEIVKYSLKSLIKSDVFVLFVLEAIILIMALVFSKLMNKKIVKRSCVFSSIIVFALYIVKYVSTLKVFIDNVSVKLIELIYFPTTLEFMIVLGISFIIMIATLLNKKSRIYMKALNVIIPVTLSFLFLTIIEYINTNGIEFDEFSVFTNSTLISLYEFAMGLFISWIVILGIIKVDTVIIKLVDEKNEYQVVENKEVIEVLDLEEEIEMPRLRSV